MTTTNTSPAMDQCTHCTVRGDIDGCRATPCSVRTSWFTQETEATHLRELAAYRITVENLEREIAAQQPAPSTAVVFDAQGYRDWVYRNLPDETLVGNGAWWADHLTAWAKRFVKVAPQPSPTPQADSQPAPVRDYPPLPDFETVEQHIYGACRRYITQDMLEPIHNLIRDAIDADRAARAPADSVLYDPNAVLDVFNSARAGSDKPVGYLRGILAVIAHWESRPEPHRWMVPAKEADSVQEDAALSAIDEVLALFPFDAAAQSFSIAGGPELKADGDTYFYSRNKVLTFLTKIKTILDAARAAQKESKP